MAAQCVINPSSMRMTADTDARGKLRHDIFAEVIKKYNSAIKKGFYLEAVTLMESIIADRLECLVVRYTDKPNRFRTLEKLIRVITDSISQFPINVAQQLSAILPRVQIWKDMRNKALHQMAKISAAYITETFDQKYIAAQQCAIDGYDIFRDLDKLCKIKA